MERKVNKQIPIQSQTIKARGWVFLVIVIGILILFALSLKDKPKVTGIDYFCFVFLTMLAFFFAYLPELTRLEIYNDGFTKKELFKDRDFLWEDILLVELDWYFHMHGANLLMKFKFNNSKEYLFPLTFYSRKNIQILCEAIVSACPEANISEKI